MSLLIKNCLVLQEDDSFCETDIFIDEGRIADFKEENADKVIDASGLIALPGLIDCHVHFREPGFTKKEDFFTGSCAAAAGGVTTIIDMPNTKPATTTVEALAEKRKLAKKSIVNYGFHFGADNNMDNIDEIKKAENIASVKVYMDVTTGNMMIEDPDWLQKVFSSCKRVMTHAEGENVRLAIEHIKNTKNNLHLAHIPSKKEIDVIREEKAKLKKEDENNNSKITAEVAPHHLFMTEDDELKLKGFALMKPGLKTRDDQNALWQALNDGTIDTIGSDHAPHTKREKKSKEPPFGVPGIETMLPLMLNAVNEKKLTLRRLIELTSISPAKIFGLKGKAKIEKGFDADITLVDMSIEKEVRNDKLFTKCKWSPFEGKTLKGWPVYTIVNGNIVFEKGKIVNDFIKGKEVEFDK